MPGIASCRRSWLYNERSGLSRPHWGERWAEGADKADLPSVPSLAEGEETFTDRDYL